MCTKPKKGTSIAHGIWELSLGVARHEPQYSAGSHGVLLIINNLPCHQEQTRSLCDHDEVGQRQGHLAVMAEHEQQAYSANYTHNNYQTSATLHKREQFLLLFQVPFSSPFPHTL